VTERATRLRAEDLSPRTRAYAAGDEILLLNGPSLNLLGEREPARYGRTTLDEIETRVASAAEAAGMTLVDSFQSNHEGDLIDRLHVRDFSWVIINPGGLTHTSVSLRDALLAVERPFAEVHLSNPEEREAFRHISLLEDVAAVAVRGMLAAGYERAVALIAELRAEVTR
jgi:3-dehydroquinate dehydratase-2